MPFDPQLWTRYQFAQQPIYFRRDHPGWFAPNAAGEQCLQGAVGVSAVQQQRFFARLPDAPANDYPGRYALLKADRLQELWFHVTNRCNLSCRHCLFTSGPHAAGELTAAQILGRAQEAAELGCRIFALTGGEPLCHPQFDEILRGLLAIEDAHVVLLTNGLLLERLLADDYDLARVHLQISVDGIAERHDAIRGDGCFAKLRRQLQLLKEKELPFTLSMCVERRNLLDMPALVEFAAEVGASNLHYLWYFIQGRGSDAGFVPPEEIFPQLVAAAEKAEAAGIQIDNLSALKTQIFAPAGTIHDGSSSGWESAAIGFDGQLYPSAALVGNPQLATPLTGSLREAWQTSPVLEQIRRATIAGGDDPLRFFTGGGDLDHSFIHAGSFLGDDPYLSLYQQVLLWLVARAAARQATQESPGLLLKMGDILESCGAHGQVALTHANCLLALAEKDSRRVVKDYYSAAALDTKEDILNPVCYAEEEIAHIPAEYRFRGYGCGSPVLDAEIEPGEVVVDLGCGRGVELFIAARKTGPNGRGIGVDMLEPMLQIAEQGATAVRKNLGYDNLEFRKGYLEQLPLEDDSIDLVLSNCVMNLSSDKRRAFAELFRSLKPGGRLVISDVVCEEEPDAAIRNDAQLQGECIGGALLQKDLVGLLAETGFVDIQLLKRFPYRVVREHSFYSLTFAAYKPRQSEPVSVIYRGPLPSLSLPDGRLLLPGQRALLEKDLAERLGEQLFVLDEQDGRVVNLDLGGGCACALPPETPLQKATQAATCCGDDEKHAAGCMVCGAALLYGEREEQLACHYCGQLVASSAHCLNRHFVCDQCHSRDALEVLQHLCAEATETDLLELLRRFRQHPAIPVHGPEHHSIIPALIITAYRNSGGAVTDDLIETAIRRGAQVIGGSCAFTGICGAATGVGIAFSLLLQANPVKPRQRQIVQQVTQQVLQEIAALEAARCCQRDCWLGLKKAAELSTAYLPVALRAEAQIGCYQRSENRECIGAACPLLQEQLASSPAQDCCCSS